MVIYALFPTSAYVIYGWPPSKKKKKAATAMMWIDTTNTTSAKHTATVHSHCTAMPTIHYNTTTQWRTTAATAAPPPPATAVRCADSQSLDGSTSCRWPNFPMNDASKKKNEECCRLPPAARRRLVHGAAAPRRCSSNALLAIPWRWMDGRKKYVVPSYDVG